MEKVKLYLPLEIDFINSDMHSELIERYGAHGLGIYFMVLMELRNHPGYRCELSAIKGAARRCLADPKMLESVLRDFQLFEFHKCGNRILISSVYINRVMQPFEEKTRNFSSTVNEKTVTVECPVYGMSTVTHREIINKIEIKIKTSTTNKKAATAAKVVDADVVVNEVKPKSTREVLAELPALHDKPSEKKPLHRFEIAGSVTKSRNCLRSVTPQKLVTCSGATGIRSECYRHSAQMLPVFSSNATGIWRE